MATSTCYNTQCYMHSCNHEQGLNWAQKVASTYATGAGGTRTSMGINLYNGGGSTNNDCYRSVGTFNTSAVPANATISSAVLNLYRKQEISKTGTDNRIYFYKVSEIGTATGYYNKAYYTSQLTSYLANGNSDNVNAWLSLSIDVASIKKAGNTHIGMRHTRDVNNLNPDGAPTGTDQVYYAAYDTGQKGYITIVWTTPPAVTTGSASALQPISATLAGNVTDAGSGTVSERGVCWSTSENPTTANAKATSAGTTGAYTVGATGLLPGTLYHFRAYVITENSTQYGADSSFRTPGGAILFNLLN